MEIAPNVHAVPMKSAGAFLITEDRLTLIDAGLAGSKPMLVRYLADIGRSIDELDRIVCTHGHPDHVGGVREIADGEPIEVFIHPADLEGVSHTVREALAPTAGGSLRGRLLQAVTPHPGTATSLNDGEVLPALGGLEAHTISGPMEIAPNVHAVPMKSAGAFLVTEDRLTLIDAGLAGSKPMLVRYLADIGRSIDELDRIVCTHGHPDHVGGVREIADGEPIEVFIHPADLEGVSHTVREALAPTAGGSLRGR
ncbi:MAG TPA: MBL fold metallo-hydrolase, partial [Candidatus Limnocylindria bacterium]|nr:MBL fold metallo-hydrolase [Candidatus Limnocylindria bacterium]